MSGSSTRGPLALALALASGALACSSAAPPEPSLVFGTPRVEARVTGDGSADSVATPGSTQARGPAALEFSAFAGAARAESAAPFVDALYTIAVPYTVTRQLGEVAPGRLASVPRQQIVLHLGFDGGVATTSGSVGGGSGNGLAVVSSPTISSRKGLFASVSFGGVGTCCGEPEVASAPAVIPGLELGDEIALAFELPARSEGWDPPEDSRQSLRDTLLITVRMNAEVFGGGEGGSALACLGESPPESLRGRLAAIDCEAGRGLVIRASVLETGAEQISLAPRTAPATADPGRQAGARLTSG